MTVLYFVLAALALGILVFIHELGHYFVAKWVGMTVETFGIGFGKPILKWRWNNVDWQLGWLPFGGFVKIKGMEFGKKEKETYKEPHEIPDGFFAKAPWRRICVAIAGPLANFILAFLIFVAIWAMGGREKPFSEYTQIVGWVDPSSELFAQGVRPGDVLTSYNGKPFTGSKDLLYASMLGGKEVTLNGYHLNYETDEKTPFSYTINTYAAPGSLDGIMTTGVTACGRYLIYDRTPDGEANPLPEGSPMVNSGISYGDRLLWADGEILYSMEQLSYILNNDQALLTVKRGDTTFLSRQPRIRALELHTPSHVRAELEDWQYEIGNKSALQDLSVLPYVINSEGYIEAPIDFLEKQGRKEAFPLHPYSADIEQPLQPGDQILAVDGTPVTHGYDILKHLQNRQIQLMVEKDVTLDTKTPWTQADADFEKSIDEKAINTLAANVGQKDKPQQLGALVLLHPVIPEPISEFALSAEAKEALAKNYATQKEQIEAIRDPQKRKQALAYLNQSHEKKLLGIRLQDRTVDYNPGPFALFGNVFTETYATLKALVFGYLHPKWISGPVGIVQVIHRGWVVGISEALFWIAAISVNLGFLNLMPIPVLDGGYICLALWEMITGRRIKAKTMERIIIPFVVLLIGLLIFLTFQDLSRLF